MKPLPVLAIIIMFLAACSRAGSEASEFQPWVADATHHNYVLVHGASGGGWDWRTMDELLTSNGHRVYRPTLTGLGEKMHLASPAIDLATHINDITNVILFEDIQEVVLVGHSYAGMVITGVMNQVPERIKLPLI